MWEVIFEPSADGAVEGPAYQRMYYSDGTYADREAGRFEYHTGNGHHHFHHTAIGGYKLFRVDDPVAGALSPVSEGPKIGYCTGDVLLAEWSSFRNDPPRSPAELLTGVCSGSPTGGSIGLNRGWGDMYFWWVEGNFVPFPAQGADGLYIVQVSSDTDDVFRETNEIDNLAYAYIQIQGDEIDVIERGRGFSPWDPAKRVVHDTRYDSPGCPTSTPQTMC